MAKLYIFGIGGSGSRVMKALTMLFTSGVKLQNYDTVVPILIDPDIQNATLQECNEFLEEYKMLHDLNANKGNTDGFFGQKIVALSDVVAGSKDGAKQRFLYDVNIRANGGGVNLDSHVGRNRLSDENRAFYDCFFTQKQRDSDLSIGFTGHPNMGAVVLESIVKSSMFEDVKSSFAVDDGVFIISSIFGGTGAAGFPLLVHTIKQTNEINGALQDAPIGAVSLLPYFNVKSENNSPISSDIFNQKAGIALNYYRDSIIEQLKSFYMIGNSGTRVKFENNPGGQEQKNQACFIELAAAQSVLHYDMNVNAPGNGVVYEFDIQQGDGMSMAQEINLYDLEHNNIALKRPLAALKLLSNYLADSDMSKVTWGQNPIIKQYLDNKTQYYNNAFVSCLERYEDWMKEMANTEPKFMAFNEHSKSESLCFVRGYKPQKGNFFGMGKTDTSYKFLDRTCNEFVKGEKGTPTYEGHGLVFLLDLLHKAIDKTITHVNI